MKKHSLLLMLCVAILSPSVSAPAQIPEYEGRGLWMHPGDFGKSEAEVEKVFQLLRKSNIQIVFALVKGTTGDIFWKSEKFGAAIAPGYENFDLLAALVKNARKYGIRLHAWLCDFTEGKNSPALKLHPEWVQLDPQGEVTSQQKTFGDNYYSDLWVCPARRPGYTDQWLLPMIEEIAKNYDVDGIHHDYVRYSGIAPDSFCFCDYCLEHYLDYNHFYYSSRPQ